MARAPRSHEHRAQAALTAFTSTAFTGPVLTASTAFTRPRLVRAGLAGLGSARLLGALARLRLSSGLAVRLGLWLGLARLGSDRRLGLARLWGQSRGLGAGLGPSYAHCYSYVNCIAPTCYFWDGVLGNPFPEL